MLIHWPDQEEYRSVTVGSLRECRMNQPDTLMTFNDEQLAGIGRLTLSVLRYSGDQRVSLSAFVRAKRVIDRSSLDFLRFQPAIGSSRIYVTFILRCGVIK